MTDIVIVNPSPNMVILSRELSAYGKKIKYASLSSYLDIKPKRIFYFIHDTIYYFAEDLDENTENVEESFLFKRGIKSFFKMFWMSKKFSKIHPYFTGADFTDYVMLRRKLLRYDLPKSEITPFPDIESISSAYPEAKIITSVIPSSGNMKLTSWDTDFDLKETFGSDYFIFTDKSSHTEAFFYGGILYTFSSAKNPLDIIIKQIPPMGRFSFNSFNEQIFTKNYNPWIINNKTPKSILVNDYSFFGASIYMSAGWYGKLAEVLNFHKSK